MRKNNKGREIVNAALEKRYNDMMVMHHIEKESKKNRREADLQRKRERRANKAYQQW